MHADKHRCHGVTELVAACWNGHLEPCHDRLWHVTKLHQPTTEGLALDQEGERSNITDIWLFLMCYTCMTCLFIDSILLLDVPTTWHFSIETFAVLTVWPLPVELGLLEDSMVLHKLVKGGHKVSLWLHQQLADLALEGSTLYLASDRPIMST